MANHEFQTPSKSPTGPFGLGESMTNNRRQRASRSVRSGVVRLLLQSGGRLEVPAHGSLCTFEQASAISSADILALWNSKTGVSGVLVVTHRDGSFTTRHSYTATPQRLDRPNFIGGSFLANDFSRHHREQPRLAAGGAAKRHSPQEKAICRGVHRAVSIASNRRLFGVLICEMSFWH